MKLKCFDKIKVRNLRIRSKSISVEYVLENNGVEKSYRLIESYNEDINVEGIDEIAILISIIPVINCGLFTKEIELDLPLNINDYKFLLESIHATAGDILVNRIIKDTRLIKREEVEIRKNIDKSFVSENLADIDVREIYDGSDIDYEGDYDKAFVLIGGGKDSLLSYGVLNEIGLKTYPFFLNESGRHWITALKSFRYFQKNIKNTVRVWSNIDRLFSFIEKNMWIIRDRYWVKNRDIYPIRLFWYPHYIFSSLPLMIKKEVGNVCMGDEYDDPNGLAFEYNGIKHYYGTYDQSQVFDKYMTEWFHLRGFKIRQWSPIRPLSGLIVERVLYNRYPNLFKLQMSCHSAHIKNGEIYPCGKCKKCIGIKIFLLANGIDPTKLYYDPVECERLDYEIKHIKPNLDTSELEHSLYLINQRYHCDLSPSKYQWYVETIRFDRINSHTDNIPYKNIRNKILDIFEEYTSGYSMLSGDGWREIGRDVLPRS